MTVYRNTLFLCLSFVMSSGMAEASLEKDTTELMQMSLVELMNVLVISSTREPVDINRAPNIIFAITDEQIKRRGYKTLLDIITHVPGWDFDTPHGG